MKKFLSLVLALVMTMSLVTISAGAKDFTDAKKVTYTEAVDVMSAVKVIDGYTDGSFNPTATLTRGAAAKIICNMILGPTTASALVADAAPYKDVPVDHTFAGYIAFCAKEGIISGYADGTFRPAGTLNGYAFMKMLLGALGYDKDVEGYEGANWSINVAKRALNIGLNKGLVGDFDGTKPVTREQACLFALNTLKADMVDYEAKTSISIGDAAVVIAGSKAQPVTTNAKSDSIKNEKGGANDAYTVQFGEKYFSDLKLSTANGIYGRPSNKWTLKKTEIGTYASVEPTFVFTKKIDSDDLYKEVGKEIAEYKWNDAYVDGDKTDAVAPNKDTDKAYGTKDGSTKTAKGVLTELYVDDTKETVTVVFVNTYLTQVGKVREDDKGTYVTVDKKGIKENKFYTDDFKADDYVLITLDINDDDDSYIATLKAPETVDGTITAVNKKEVDEKLDGSYLKLDGTKYEYASGYLGDLDNSDKVPVLDTKYQLYLDEYGYVKGFKALDNLYDQYLYVIETDWTLGSVKANVLLADGTIATISVKDELQDGTDLVKQNPGVKEMLYSNLDKNVYAYDVDSKDVYTLKTVTTVPMKGVTVKDGKAYGKDANGNNANYVIDADTVFADKKDKVAYTGYEAVPEYTNANIIIVETKKGISDVVFVIDWDSKSTVDDFYFYVADAGDFETYKAEKKLVERVVYVDGVKESKFIMTKDASNTVVTGGEGLYQVKGRDTDGNVNKVELIGADVSFAKDTVSVVGNKSFVSTQTEVAADKKNTEGTGKWTFDDDTIFVFIEKDKDGDYKKVTTGPAKSIDVYSTKLADTDDVSLIRVVKAKDAKALLVYVVAVKVADLNTAEKEAVKAADKAIADAKAVLATVSNYSGAELMTLMNKLGDAKKALMDVDKANLPAEKLAEVNSTIDALTNANTTAGNDYAKYLADEAAKQALADAKNEKLGAIKGIRDRLTPEVKALLGEAAVELLNAKLDLAESQIKNANTTDEVNKVTVPSAQSVKDAEDQLDAADKAADKAIADANADLSGIVNRQDLVDLQTQVAAATTQYNNAYPDVALREKATALTEAATTVQAAIVAFDAAQDLDDAYDTKMGYLNGIEERLDGTKGTVKVVDQMSAANVLALKDAIAEAKAKVETAYAAKNLNNINAVVITPAALITALETAEQDAANTDAVNKTVTALDNATLTASDIAANAVDAVKAAVIAEAIDGATITFRADPVVGPTTFADPDVDVTVNITVAKGTVSVDKTVTVAFTNSTAAVLAAAKAEIANIEVTVTNGTAPKGAVTAAVVDAMNGTGISCVVRNTTDMSTAATANCARLASVKLTKDGMDTRFFDIMVMVKIG